MKNLLLLTLVSITLISCSNEKLEKKGFQVSTDLTTEENEILENDSMAFKTRPINVLMTKSIEHRISPIYKINYNKKTKEYFTGSNHYNHSYQDYYDYNDGNNWNHNYMPGLSALNGYNIVNISHFNTIKKTNNNLFNEPVLVKTLYFPAPTKDTLNFKPISRNYYLVSVYDKDTNKDGFINVKDLRHFYYFDLDGKNKTQLIPSNFSVMSSEYDKENDFMYVFAKEDKNNNGKMEIEEQINVFWINLKNPLDNGLVY